MNLPDHDARQSLYKSLAFSHSPRFMARMLICPKCRNINTDGERRCTACGASLVGVQPTTDLAGHEAQIERDTMSDGTILKGSLWGAGLGVVAVGIWVVLSRATDYELHFVALLIGLGCGFGMSRGGGNQVSALTGLISSGMTIGGVLLTKSILISMAFADWRTEAIADATSDKSLTAEIASELLAKQEAAEQADPESASDEESDTDDSETALDMSTESEEEEYDPSHYFPKKIWEKATADFNAMSAAERNRRVTAITQDISNNMEKAEEEVGNMWLFFRSIWGIGFIISAVAMAFRLGCGRPANS